MLAQMLGLERAGVGIKTAKRLRQEIVVLSSIKLLFENRKIYILKHLLIWVKGGYSVAEKIIPVRRFRPYRRGK